MVASRGRTSPVDRVAEIRADIEAARTRIAGTLEALRFKADLPARLGDSVGNAALSFTEHVLDRVTSPEDGEPKEQDPVTTPPSNEATVSQETDERAGYPGSSPKPA
jgi:Protein of unknown function (DUF3618)